MTNRSRTARSRMGSSCRNRYLSSSRENRLLDTRPSRLPLMLIANPPESIPAGDKRTKTKYYRFTSGAFTYRPK